MDHFTDPAELQRLLATLQQQTAQPASRPSSSVREERDDVPVLDLSAGGLPPSAQQDGDRAANTEEERAKMLLNMLARGLLGNKDGDPTPNRGPCKCGFKHYLEGKEYDYVFTLETTKGGLNLGFNATDNPYTVAADFIAKHRLNERSLDDTRHISAIANEIIERTQDSTHSISAAPPTTTQTSTWNPYQAQTILAPAGTHSMLNPTTGKWESIVSPLEMRARGSIEDLKKNEQLLAEKKRLRAVQEQKQRERERIRQQIMLSRQEKMLEERKKEEERRIQKAVLHEGILTWEPQNLTTTATTTTTTTNNEDPDGHESPHIATQAMSVTPSSPRARNQSEKEDEGEHREGEKEYAYIREQQDYQDSSEEDDAAEDEEDDEEDNSGNGSDDNNDEHFEDLLLRARADQEEASRQTSNRKIVGLASIRDQGAEEAVATPTRKEEWLEGGLPLLNYKYQKLGELKFIGALDQSGFGRQEMQNILRILRVLTKAKHKSPPATESESKKSLSWGKGQSLRDSDTVSDPAQTQPLTTGQTISVDKSKPFTSIALRLPSGQRLLVECNLTHTIADLHAHIHAHAPSPQSVELVSAFPRKVFNNMDQTIEEAGLRNASLTVANK